jgi:hypothetical protein
LSAIARVGWLGHSRLESRSACIAEIGVIRSETILYLICIGNERTASLSTSGVNAKRCSSVPCEKEGWGKAIADSNASDTRHCAKGIDRNSINLFWLSMFLGASIRYSQTYLTFIIVDFDTPLLEPALAAKRQRL